MVLELVGTLGGTRGHAVAQQASASCCKGEHPYTDTKEGALEIACTTHPFACWHYMSEAMQDKMCMQCNTALDDNVLQCAGCGVKVHE